MIQHPSSCFRHADHVQIVQPLLGLQQTQEMEDAVEHAHMRIGGDGDAVVALDAQVRDDESLAADCVQRHAGEQAEVLRRANQQRTILRGAVHNFGCVTQQAAEAPAEFIAGRAQSIRFGIQNHMRQAGAVVFAQSFIADRGIAQPEFISIFGG